MRRLILLLSLAAGRKRLSVWSRPGTGRRQSAAATAAASAARPAANQATSPENCGTPDRFLPCPPLPRHPLPYFPENRRQ